MKFSIMGHVAYQSVANFVYFEKDRRTVCQKSNTTSPSYNEISLPCLLACPHPFLPASLRPSQLEILLGW